MRSFFLIILGLSTWSLPAMGQTQSLTQTCIELFRRPGEPLRLFRGPATGIYFLVSPPSLALAPSRRSGAATLRLLNFRESSDSSSENTLATLPSGFVVEQIKFSEQRLVLVNAEGQLAVLGYDATDVPRIYNRALPRNFMDRKIDWESMEDLEKIMDVEPEDFSESGDRQ
jgi:hypothetical protein